MESHHPAELGVVKRVRMEGVRVTFFHLTAAIKAISTMEILVSKIVMGTMMVTIGGNTVTALTSVSVITPPGIFMVLMASTYGCCKKEECYPYPLHSYPLYHHQLCWMATFHPPSSLLLCGTCNM